MPDYFFSGDNSDMNKPFSMNTSRRRNGDGSRQKAIQSEAFEDDDIPDDAFLEAGRCHHLLNPWSTLTNNTPAHGFDDHQPQQRGSVDTASSKGRKNERRTSDLREDTDEVQPVMLENGKYNCNHKCKDKSTSVP